MNMIFNKTIEFCSQPAYGVVEQPILPKQGGRVRFQGSIWKARLYYPDCDTIDSGDFVKVVALEGITLLVVPQDYRLPDWDEDEANSPLAYPRSTYHGITTDEWVLMLLQTMIFLLLRICLTSWATTW